MQIAALIAGIPALTIVLLLGGTVLLSLQEDMFATNFTVKHYIELYFDPFAYETFLNTLNFSFSTLFTAFLFGVPIAWIAERSDIKGRAVIYTVMTIGIFIPAFFTAMGWLFLLHPRIGMVNIWLKSIFGLADSPLSIINVAGMGVVQGLGSAGVVFVLTAASLRSMDSRLEESAEMSGASFLTILRCVTLPLVWPSLLASALYVFTIGIGAFDVPLVIGLSNRIYTFSTYLYVVSNPISGLPNYGLVAASATFMVIFALLLSWWYGKVLVKARKYQVISGKGYRPKLTPLGKWKVTAWGFVLFYFAISKFMPLTMMLWASLLPYFQPFSISALSKLTLGGYTNLNWQLIGRGLYNSALIVLTVPVLALAISLLFSWVVLRSRSRFRIVLDSIAFLPHAVPHTVFAFAALVFVLAVPTGLYGTLTLIVIVMAVSALSFGSRITNSALIQINPELEEAAAISGANAFEVLRLVIFPLLKSALLFGWLWIALLTFRELTTPMILFSPDNIVFSVVVWNLWNAGSLTEAAAANIIMIGALLPFIVLYWRSTGKVRLGG